MLGQSLNYFITVASCGSFSKAAEKLYITHPALLKQINMLESDLGVALFYRTRKGVELTDAGKSFYKDALNLQEELYLAIGRAKASQGQHEINLRVGSSTLYPCQTFLDIWDEFSEKYPNIHFEVVPFADEQDRLDNLGKRYDFLTGVYDVNIPKDKIDIFKVGSLRFHLLVPRKSELSSRKELKFEDLKGMTIYGVKSGLSDINDRIRMLLTEKWNVTMLEPKDAYYTIHNFNQCAKDGIPLLSLECWANVHPSLVSVPINEEVYMPYGIIVPAVTMGDMDIFMKILKEELTGTALG